MKKIVSFILCFAFILSSCQTNNVLANEQSIVEVSFEIPESLRNMITATSSECEGLEVSILNNYNADIPVIHFDSYEELQSFLDDISKAYSERQSKSNTIVINSSDLNKEKNTYLQSIKSSDETVYQAAHTVS